MPVKFAPVPGTSGSSGAPPVYRPGSMHLAQMKPWVPGAAPPVYRPAVVAASAPPVYRPGVVNTGQMKAHVAGAGTPPVYRPDAANRKAIRRPGIVQRLAVVQRMIGNSESSEESNSGSEWVDSEEEQKRKKEARKRKKEECSDSDPSYSDSEVDEGAPSGYMSVRQYLDEGFKNNDRTSLIKYADAIWVRPTNNHIAIYFKPAYVQDWQWARPTDQREESKNQGDLNLTWHHTTVFQGNKCLMQLVPTAIHASISHIGGVALR